MTWKLGSLFDGSGGFPLAASLCGIEPVWASEVEPYPIAVTRSRFPAMKHLGDISKINGAEIEPVDIITFGSPCQDLSVAGKRAGLKHEANGDEETTRSGLFMEAVRIIREMREATNGEYPRFALWENVPGAFSSNKGEDFRIVLEELIKVVEPWATMPEVPPKGWAYADSYIGDGWSLAYRVFDAQYWGVPQRRRRIHLVADFRGECAREVLFEREGVRGYFAKGRTSGESTSCHAEGSSGTDDREGKCYGIVSKGNGEVWPIEERHMSLSCGGGQAGQGYPCAMVPYTLKIRSGCAVDSSGKAAGKGALIQENKAATLAVSQDQYLFQPVGFDSYNLCETGEVGRTVTTASGGLNEHIPCVYYTDNTDSAEPVTLEPGIAAREGGHIYQGVSGTLRANAGDNQMAIAYAADQSVGFDDYNFEITGEKTCTLRSGASGGACGVSVVTPTQQSDNNQLRACKPVGLIDSIGGQAERGWEGDVAPCLKATHYKFAPVVAMDAAGFCPEQSAKTRGIGWEEEKAPTLRAGVTPATVCKTYDTRGNGDGDTANTITGDHERRTTDYTSVVAEPVVYDGAGITSPINASNPSPGDPCHTLSTDSRNYVVLSDPVYCLQGNGIDRADTAGCNGKGWNDESCYTLNTIDRPAVAFQTYQKVSGPLMANSHPGSYTGQDAFSDMLVAGVDCRNMNEYEELYPTLQAKPNGGQSLNFSGAVRTQYIVRRLTPTECARLQAFPDKWGHPDKKTRFSDEEYKFWLEVRNTHAAINGKTVKDYTKAQMLTWYSKLHTDSAEYKMWGNGIALPPALYCMQGMADALEKNEEFREEN